MKYLLVMRHAKSSFKEKHLKDRERPLTKRGKKNATAMGTLIKENQLNPQRILSSSVVRARQTTELVVAASGYQGEVIYLDNLFMAEAELILDGLRLLCDDQEKILIIGHNPGLESLVQLLTGKVVALPPGALANLCLPISSWNEINKDTEADLVQMLRPKEL